MQGIYVHIPFCKQACNYCNFHFSTSLQYKSNLINAIGAEIGIRHTYLLEKKINSIYFGGGTPSLLSDVELGYIIDQLSKYYYWEDNIEITIEVNPDDVNKAFINKLKHLPFNRISMGVQSFFDEDLKWMNRAHTATQADSAVKMLQDAGYTNISIDLIYGSPTLSKENWKTNIAKTIALQVPHVSAYGLTVETNTALAKAIAAAKTPPLNEEMMAWQMEYLIDTLGAAGYEQYEISNFAKEKLYAQHNSSYWLGAHYLGIGPSAHSYNGNSRQWNVSNNNKYIAALQTNQLDFEIEQLSNKEKYNETIMVGLRTMWGIDTNNIDKIYGHEQLKQLLLLAQPYIDKKNLVFQNGKLFLSNSGKLLADKIMSNLFWEEL
jgi:oxygen-independent coproporphyrinogen-3 oxidase